MSSSATSPLRLTARLMTPTLSSIASAIAEDARESRWMDAATCVSAFSKIFSAIRPILLQGITSGERRRSCRLPAPQLLISLRILVDGEDSHGARDHHTHPVHQETVELPPHR